MTTKTPKRNPRATVPGRPGLGFVLDVSALTEKGFVGRTTFEGEEVDLEFDDAGAGVFLTSAMAERLHVRKGSRVALTVEEGSPQASELAVAGVTKSPRISDPKVYYAVGREGGAVLRIYRA